MCGIAGVLYSHLPADHRMLERMADALAHRGPDSRGTYACGPLGMAQTRLSIVDVSPAGDQPFHDDRFALVYNGEIYNAAQLAKELVDEGEQIRGHSDTAVLFAALRRWGVETTLTRLQGMFAFAFADTHRGSVHLCRDRLGIKPLYWAAEQGDVYWASEVKGLAVATTTEPEPVAVLAALAGGIEHRGIRTCFKHVSQVEPGTYVFCEHGRSPVPKRYFHPAQLVDEARFDELANTSTARVAAEFLALLDGAVDKMLMSDVPIGCFLSGGIDSALVAALASRSGADISFFTADVVGRWSELDKATEVARHIGRPISVAPFAPADLVSGWARHTWMYEAPMISFPNAVALAAVADRARSGGVKPVLTGEGSDELFLGYNHLARQRYVDLFSLPLRAVERLYNKLSPGLAELVFEKPGTGLADRLVEAALYEPSGAPYDPVAAFPFLDQRHAREQTITLELMRTHLRGLLHRADRMGMQAGIEARFPFLDEDLLAFGVNLPVKHKIKVVPCQRSTPSRGCTNAHSRPRAMSSTQNFASR